MRLLEVEDLNIDENTQFWKENTAAYIIECQRTTITWTIDYFIGLMTSGEQGNFYPDLNFHFSYKFL